MGGGRGKEDPPPRKLARRLSIWGNWRCWRLSLLKDCRLYAPHSQIWPEYELETASCFASYQSVMVCVSHLEVGVKKFFPCEGKPWAFRWAAGHRAVNCKWGLLAKLGIIPLPTTLYKSRFFAITEFNNCFIIRSPSLFLKIIFGKSLSDSSRKPSAIFTQERGFNNYA